MAFDLPLATAVWAISSGVALIAIGSISLLGGRARARGAFAFGCFAILWGIQIIVGNLVDVVASDAVARLLYLTFLASAFPATYFLVEFAASHSGPRERWTILRGAAAAVGAVSGLILLVAPELLFGGLSGEPGARVTSRGPLYTWLVVAPQFAAFGFALVMLYSAKRTAASPRIALRIATLLVGIGLYVSFASGYYLSGYVGGFALRGNLDRLLPYILIFVALTSVTLLVAAATLRDARFARTKSERHGDLLVACAMLLALGWGIFEGVLSLGPLNRFSTVGLWRLAGMAIIAYGLARWRLADLPTRATHVAANGAGVSAAAAGGLAAYGAGTLVSASPVVPIAFGATVVLLGLFPGVKIARKLFERAASATWANDDDAQYAQRVDAYRAALESSLARGSLDEDADFLAALRERFGITESEDRLLRHYARACILSPRDGDLTAAYERLRLLGEGGAGRTWLARDRIRDRLVVLKEPLERWQREAGVREMVLREARLAARIRHPNVVSVEEVVDHKGLPVIVMEYCEGGSLSQMLHRKGVLPWTEAIDVIVPVLRGVEAVHAAGIVHRDLKPSNILLSAEGVPKVGDFGIAVRPGEASGKTVVEGTTFVGTFAYLAPEVREGGIGDKRADVYACAAILHEMLYGSPPGLRLPVLATNDVTAGVAATLARALSADPAARPASARLLAEELTSTIVRPRRT